ncbi:MAG: flavodoxin, partial [Selenomonadaceae bacterium]|nr:flavodoxin [Selenomonadaceae bacterium]
MKKIFLLLMMILMVSGCGGAEEKSSAEPAKVQTSDKKILVMYFSRTGEEYNVGNITKGNTAIVAYYIAQKTGADT